MQTMGVDALKIGLFSGGLFLFLILELVIPYRGASVPKTRRWLNNLGMGMINTIIIAGAGFFLTMQAPSFSFENHHGFLNIIQLPHWLKIVDTIVIMDFFLYVWHVLNHRLPLLWRLHRVHHTDLNVDVSTAARIHIFEKVLALVVRWMSAYSLGADPKAIIIFEILYISFDLLRHSGILLPAGLEKFIWIFFVPPAMHRIHHSVDTEERNTNFGTIFSIWDRFLGTLLTGVDQEHIWYGVDGHIQEKKLDLHHLLYMPFSPAVK